MKNQGLAAILLASGAIASSGCAVAVGAGAGAGAYKVFKDDKAEKESLNSIRFPAYKITRVYECRSDGDLCTEAYVDKRTERLAREPVWYEDGWMYSGKSKPDGALDQVCWMKGDAVDKGKCKLLDTMKVKDARDWQKSFEEVKSAYAKQK